MQDEQQTLIEGGEFNRMRQLIGWLSADIPELHGVEIPLLCDSLDRFIAAFYKASPVSGSQTETAHKPSCASVTCCMRTDYSHVRPDCDCGAIQAPQREVHSQAETETEKD